MNRTLIKTAVLVLALAVFSAVASADELGVGLLTYDTISSTDSQLDITNLTGADAFAAFGFPITTQLTFTVTGVVVDTTTGPVDLAGGDFTTVDSEGDVDCTAAACNLFADDITSATLTGTLSPTTGLAGIGSDTGIASYMSDGLGSPVDETVTITPGCGTYLTAGCDIAEIFATGTTGTVTTTPEPGTWALLGIGMIGLLVVGRKRLRGAGSGRFSTAAGY